MLRPPPFSEIDAAMAALGSTARRTRPSRSTLDAIAGARRLLPVVQPLRPRFAELKGFDLAAIDRLPEIIQRAENAEIAWEDSCLQKGRASLREARDQAEALRFRLVATARFLLRSDKAALRRLEGFHSRRRLPDLVADLNGLAEVIERHAGELASTEDLPDQPARVARELAEKLVRGSRTSAHAKALGDRNAAAALLSMALYEIRSAGRFLFRYEPSLLSQLGDRAATGRTRRPRARTLAG